MSNQIFLPESMYSVDSNMSLKKLLVFYENNCAITGKVTRLNIASKLFEVDLGGGFKGTMSFGESTIYPIRDGDDNPAKSLFALVGQYIRANIVDMKSDHVILSRKENMIKALEFFKTQTHVKSAQITAFSRLSAFIDMGAGITGRCCGSSFANVFFNDIKDIGISEGEFISVNILQFLESTNNFDLSRVLPDPSQFNDLSQHDTIVCKVFTSLPDDETGYFVLINKKYQGLLDSRVPLNYGDEVVGSLKKITEKGLQLNFVRKL